MSRRQFMALGKTLRRGIASVAGVFIIWDHLWEHLKNLKPYTVELDELFPMWPEIQVVPGTHHPVDGYHSDVRIALERLTPLVPRFDPIVVARADELPRADLARDLVLIGGPVTNAISLRLHGYEYSNEKISNRPTRKTTLRWCFHYPRKRRNDPSNSRYVAGKLRATMPKALVDRQATGDLALPRYCRVDPETGRIQSDYLLLTVMPNSVLGRSTGFTIIDVADLHGQGDKVFADVLGDDSSRKELAEAVSGKRYFQALYEVPVTHDDANRTTSPGTPTLLDYQVLA